MDGVLYSLVTIVLLIIFLVMVYQFYTGVEKSNILYLGPGNQSKLLSGKNAQPSIYANEYTFESFVYVESDTYNKDKDPILFYKGNVKNQDKAHLFVKLHSTDNKLIVKYDSKDCSVDLVPIGRWFHLAVVLRDQALDVYVDGKLKRHCYSPGKVRDINVSEDIVINPASAVKLAKFMYYSRALSSQEIMENRDKGPDAGLTDALMEMMKDILTDDEVKKDKEEITKQKCALLNKNN